MILTTPVTLDMDNLPTKETFNMLLELKEHFEYIRFVFKKVKPCKTTISINKADIKLLSTN